MPRRRRVQSRIDQLLASYGITSSGRVGTLSHLTPEQYREMRAVQRIGTKDEKSRAKFNRRTRRILARTQHEHSILLGIRYNDFPDWYETHGDDSTHAGSDGLEQLETQTLDYVNQYLANGAPLSVALSNVAENWKAFRGKGQGTFAKHFSSEEIDHVLNHVTTDLTIDILRRKKLGER